MAGKLPLNTNHIDLLIDRLADFEGDQPDFGFFNTVSLVWTSWSRGVVDHCCPICKNATVGVTAMESLAAVIRTRKLEMNEHLWLRLEQVSSGDHAKLHAGQVRAAFAAAQS